MTFKSLKTFTLRVINLQKKSFKLPTVIYGLVTLSTLIRIDK